LIQSFVVEKCESKLLLLSNAFPQTLRIIKNAITMPVSQVTCERSFSNMKIIKNSLQNSMTDKRLSDLTVLKGEYKVSTLFSKSIAFMTNLYIVNWSKYAVL
jgi:hypothetical protein